jgi:hypothetical protein
MRQLNYGESARQQVAYQLPPAVEAGLILAVAAVLLIPCVWQPRILAGDIPSHVYNAWLATQVEQGNTPGLILTHPLTNVLSDWMLQGLIARLGPVWAERIVIGAAVEIFFWGGFAFAAAVAGSNCWVIAPSLGMLAYGLVFQMGFLNFYLATGLSLWLMALLWQPDRRRLWLSLPVALLALFAHAMPLAWAIASLLYATGLRRIPAAYRAMFFAGGIATLVLAQTVLFRFFPTRWSLAGAVSWEGVLGFTGAEQFWLYGRPYLITVTGMLLIWFLLFLERVDRGRILADPAVHLWALSAVGLVLMPAAIQVPLYEFSFTYIPQRLALLVAVSFCAMVAGGNHGRSLTRASSLLAASFFTMLYLDMRSLNIAAGEVTRLVADLRAGERVAAAIQPSANPRLNGLAHVVSAACVTHCYDFGNYEPATGQFRLRVVSPGRYAAATMEVVHAIGNAVYVVAPGEEPIYSICAGSNPGPRLVLRKLAAGDKVCSVILPGDP